MNTLLLPGKRALDLSSPKVMSILNVTPDSFSDGGQLFAPSSGALLDKIFQAAEQAIADGASILDVGGESTRPGAKPVPLAQERERVLPVVEGLLARFDVCVSLDTQKPELMQEAINLGVHMINDVNALQAPNALEVVANSHVALCIMHKQGSPQTMQQCPQYQEDVVKTVQAFLASRIAACEAKGIERSRICIDPGFGFGKTLAHNLALLRQFKSFQQLGCAMLAGLSRKSLLGEITKQSVDNRLAGSLALAYEAVLQGAHIVRVHDTRATSDIVKVFNALHR